MNESGDIGRGKKLKDVSEMSANFHGCWMKSYRSDFTIQVIKNAQGEIAMLEASEYFIQRKTLFE